MLQGMWYFMTQIFKKEEDWESIADRVKKFNVIAQYPMRVVAVGPNPNDRVQVYRPWTPMELCATVNQFPKPDKNPTPRDIQQLMMACFGERFEEVRQASGYP